MNKIAALMGIMLTVVFLSACGKSDFYGEYSYDGEPRYQIKIMNNDTMTIDIDGYMSLDYEKQGDQLHISQDDLHFYYIDSITAAYVEFNEAGNLSYNVSRGGEITEIGEFQYIEGTDGDSGTPNVFWMTVSYMFFGFLIFIGMFAFQAMVQRR